MAEKQRLPESKGKFRKDIFEKAAALIGQLPSAKSPYRAVGEVRGQSRTRLNKTAARELRAALDHPYHG